MAKKIMWDEENISSDGTKKHRDFEKNKQMIEEYCEKYDPFRQAKGYDIMEHDIVKMTAYDTNLQICYIPAKKKPLGTRCCVINYNQDSEKCMKETKVTVDFIFKISNTPLEKKI